MTTTMTIKAENENNSSNVVVLEGGFECRGLKIALLAARFNEFIVQKLIGGARDCFLRHGGLPDDLTLAWVPGAFEIPLGARTLVRTGRYDAVVTLGAVIRGATPHFDYVAGEVAKGVAQVGLESGVPVIFGVLTTENIEQAIERAGTKAGNKGFDAMMSAIEMINFVKLLCPSIPATGALA